MRKLHLGILLILMNNQVLAQDINQKPKQFSIGAGLGYGAIQYQYDDGSYSYSYWSNQLRPFIINLRYSWKNEQPISGLVNTQLTFYNRIRDDIVDNPVMFYLTCGVRFIPRQWNRFKILFFGGGATFDKTYGFVLGSGIGIKIIQRLELEIQTAYARTFRTSFTNSQIVDGRLLIIYVF